MDVHGNVTLNVTVYGLFSVLFQEVEGFLESLGEGVASRSVNRVCGLVLVLRDPTTK